MNIEKHFFGKCSTGQDVHLFVLTNANGVTAKVITFGGRITELHTPDREGKSGNIVLGFDNLAQYEHDRVYLGATIGRVANRITAGFFQIDHRPFRLRTNNGANTLHGGLLGFDKRVWEADETQVAGNRTLRLRYFSPDGEEGFHGNLRATTLFTLLDDNELRVEFVASTDSPTAVNMTNHSYFNLKGPSVGTILEHRLMINAEQYTPSDQNLLPTGEISAVAGSPMDFTKSHAISQRFSEMPRGYDHNFVLKGGTNQMKQACRLEEDTTGRVMEIETTQPGLQFYTGNFLDGTVVGIGGAYQRYSALCLETQHFPDSVHHPNFPSIVLRADQEYRQAAVYRFSTL
ncbi:MAG TPA: aldose epimerase family protein [Tepidisphaeraceae bacterium]|nr:aldose epimerase family protein [Tepidisphaeraceae bacterium]